MTTQFEIQNLKCGGCANTTQAKLSKIETIEDIKVDLEASLVSFAYKKIDDVELVKKELTNLGYPIVGNKNVISTKAKSFVSCAMGRMTKLLNYFCT